MTRNLCTKNKFGFCKFSDKCRFRHINVKCEEKTCPVYTCEKRHPRTCRNFRDVGYCKFTTYCKYEHSKHKHIEENSEKIAKLEKKIPSDRNNDSLAKQVEVRMDNFEKMLNNQRKDLEEKNAQISSLEMRLNELEKKHADEKKSKDIKIKDLENALKSKTNDEKEEEVFKCTECKFETVSKKGLSIHIKRKHTNLKDQNYPSECDFCERTLDSEREMKMHLKTCHTVRDATFRCEDCDFTGENEPTVSLHHGKTHSCDFECGICDFKAKSKKKLNTHLSTCEIYECDECYFRVKTMSAIGSHMEEVHENENVKICHLKLDRKDENFVSITEHWRDDLFKSGNV